MQRASGQTMGPRWNQSRAVRSMLVFAFRDSVTAMSNSSLKVLRSARSKAADGDKGSTGSFVTSNSLMWTAAIGQVPTLEPVVRLRSLGEPKSQHRAFDLEKSKMYLVGSCAA